MSWISDLSANRFNNTYFRDAHGSGFAVDMSGDLIVRNGNVGIGTTSPDSALDISGDLVVREGASIGAAKQWVGSCLELRKPSGTAINLVYLGDGDGDKSWNIQQTSAGDTLSFGYTSEFNVHPYSNILNIDGTGTGKVGIGTTSPDNILHVRGSGPQLILEGQSNEDALVRFSAGPSYANRFHEIRCQFYALPNNGWRNKMLFKVNNGGQSNPSETMTLTGDGNLGISGTFSSSDDRIKKNEVYITNAIETLLKLKPQLYDKYLVNDSSSNVLELSENFVRESGLIAQELYYDAPELRHLVMPADDAYDLSNNISSHDIQVDPDYSMWGSTPASLNYCGLIAYLIKGMQEQQEEIQAEKAKTASLESQLSDILSRLSTLENP